jgi:AcrR family transcriptional regulator
MPTRRAPAISAPDLRQRILDTSRALLDDEGVGALSMREVARRASVTHQAPYHHFADRESILAELVAQGFDELAHRLARANDMATTTGRRAALLASSEAYVGFAIEHPGVFRIMFRPDLCDPARFPAAQAAGERAYGELLRLVRLLHDDQSAEALSSTYWAHVHGLACLIVDGPIGVRLPGRKARAAHARAATLQFADFVLGAQAPDAGRVSASPAAGGPRAPGRTG